MVRLFICIHWGALLTSSTKKYRGKSLGTRTGYDAYIFMLRTEENTANKSGGGHITGEIVQQDY